MYSKMNVLDFNSKLYEDFPKFFNDNFWGVECSPGWFNIIYTMCERLSLLEHLPEDFSITQIKEKFGDLRVYTSANTIFINSIISDAEKQSAVVCEICGATPAGHSTINGYLRTLCDTCHKAKVQERRTQEEAWAR